MKFETPWALLILLSLPVLLWLRRRQHMAGTIGFSALSNATQSGRSWRQRLAFVPLWTRLGVLALLAFAIARPRQGWEQIRESKQGIAIEMILDCSGSMEAPMYYRGERKNRLEVVKQVFKEFVLGDGRKFPGRPADLVGIVAFSGFADTVCPLTLAHETFAGFLETIQPGGGTAIGDAIALGAARLKATEETFARQSRPAANHYEIKSKIMILLTDGQSNAGKREPLQAAKQAAQWGLKIYAIGIGGTNAAVPPAALFGAVPPMTFGGEVDQSSLKAVAEATGGLFRMAEDAEALESICQEIDRLERSEVPVTRHRNYRECFSPLALAAFVLLILETGLNNTAFRRIP